MSMKMSMSGDPVTSRIRRIALLNGGSIVVIALLGAAASVFLGAAAGAIIGLLFAAAGAIEIRGRVWLPGHPLRARYWLCGAQVYFVVLVITYAIWRLSSLNAHDILQVLGPQMVDTLKARIQQQHGILLPDAVLGQALVRMMGWVYWALIVISLIYQGILFSYYARKVN